MTLDAKRQAAARVAAFVDLRDIRLWGVRAELKNLPGDNDAQISYKLNADLQVQHEAGSSILLLLGAYSLDLFLASDPADPEDKLEVASLEFDLNGLFEVEEQPDEPFELDELEAFGETTGQFALYPYARELVANLTARMGLPPLHVGVMRLHLETREG